MQRSHAPPTLGRFLIPAALLHHRPPRIGTHDTVPRRPADLVRHGRVLRGHALFHPGAQLLEHGGRRSSRTAGTVAEPRDLVVLVEAGDVGKQAGDVVVVGSGASRGNQLVGLGSPD